MSEAKIRIEFAIAALRGQPIMRHMVVNCARDKCLLKSRNPTEQPLVRDCYLRGTGPWSQYAPSAP